MLRTPKLSQGVSYNNKEKKMTITPDSLEEVLKGTNNLVAFKDLNQSATVIEVQVLASEEVFSGVVNLDGTTVLFKE